MLHFLFFHFWAVPGSRRNRKPTQLARRCYNRSLTNLKLVGGDPQKQLSPSTDFLLIAKKPSEEKWDLLVLFLPTEVQLHKTEGLNASQITCTCTRLFPQLETFWICFLLNLTQSNSLAVFYYRREAGGSIQACLTPSLPSFSVLTPRYPETTCVHLHLGYFLRAVPSRVSNENIVLCILHLLTERLM